MEQRRTTSLFATVNSDEVAASLNLSDKARSDAVNERPTSDLEKIQGTEWEVVSYFQRLRRKAVDETRSLLMSLSDERRSIDPNSAKNELLSIPGQCEMDIDRLNARHVAKLESLTDSVRKQKKDYELFRQENGLHRIARYPDSKILHYSIIAAIVIIETLANAYFFQRGNELGFLGGVQQAFIFSLINVFWAIFIGDNLFRLKNHVEFSQRVIGWSSLVVYGFVSVAFNLAIGHYRAALQKTVMEGLDPLSAFEMAWETYIANPFAIADIEAWILVVMGILIGLIAFVKAYNADDPYPGYGEVQRAYFSLRAELESEIGVMQDAVTRTIDAALERVNTIPAELRKSHSKLGGLLQDASVIPERLKSHLYDLQDACNQLLRQYRHENERIRQTSAPGYFAETYEFQDELSLGEVSLEEEIQKVKQLGDDIDNLRPDIEAIKEKIKELNSSALDAIARRVS